MSRTSELPPQFAEVDLWIHSRQKIVADGSIRSWYSETAKDGSYPYPEIAGYYLIYEAWRKRKDPKQVLGTARWLVSGPKGARIARAIEPNVEYTFDAGIIASGLLSFAENTGMCEYADAARTILEPIISSLLNTGSVQTILTGICNRPQTWSTRSRAHLIKVVQALLKAGTEEAYRAADVLITMGIRALSNNDLEEFSDIDGKLYLHPMLYTAEGLWIWSSAANDLKARAIAELLYRRAENIVIENSDITIRQVSERNNVAWCQGDVLSQLCRLSGLLQIEMRAPSIMDHVRLLRNPRGTAVAYAYGNEHQNTWATIFYAQALAAQSDAGMTINWKDIA